MEKRNNFGIILAILLAILAGIVVYGAFRSRATVSTENTPLPLADSKQSMVPYGNQNFGIAFEYPSGYFKKERADVGSPEFPQLSVVLVDDTPIHRDILEGKVEGTEGPVSITVDVYQNPNQLSAEAWAKEDTNWNVSSRELSSFQLDEHVSLNRHEAVSFSWEGLYRGKSVIFTNESRAYVFSVTWNSPEDQILKDFDMILRTIRI